MSYPVKWFTSEMGGAPVGNGQSGSLTGIFDACLVDGFGAVTVTSAVIGSGVCTVTVDAGHGFLDHQIVLISGAAQSGLNDEHRVTVNSSTEFEFSTDVADGAASGAITAKTAPVGGWNIKFSDTNRRVYSRDEITATLMEFRVDATADTKDSAVVYAESFSDIDTPINVQTSNFIIETGLGDNSSTAIDWYVIADGKTLYFLASEDTLTALQAYAIGDFASLLPGDANNYLMTHKEGLLASNELSRLFIAKGVDGLSNNVATTLATTSEADTSIGITSFDPIPGHGPLFIKGSIVLIAEGYARGVLRGACECPGSTISSPATGTYTDSGGHYLVVTTTARNSGRVAFDLGGPWG